MSVSVVSVQPFFRPFVCLMAHTPACVHAPPQSKYSPEELEVRGQMVQQVLAEIQDLKEASLQGYVRGYQGGRGGPIIMPMPMEESEAFKGPLGACAVGHVLICVLTQQQGRSLTPRPLFI